MENDIYDKSITELLGDNFYIPEYQRGYRWTSHHVRQLLDDIWEYRNTPDARYTFYCLQPVVVKDATWKDIDGNEVSGYELIDGQQRLTTIHRIITYLLVTMETDLRTEKYDNDLYSIYYKTRLESKRFLETSDYDDSKPDLYYLSEAFKTIKDWFETGDKGIPRNLRDNMLSVLLPGIYKDNKGETITPEWSVKVIWYKVNDSNNTSSEELFKRLNRGKIPLTSAELIKAKLVNSERFSSRTDDEKAKRKTEIVQVWDEIEAGLNDPKFWSFITNKKQSDYSNKIELLFDIVTDKPTGHSDKLYSFIKFFEVSDNDLNKSNSIADLYWDKWVALEEVYRSFRFWFTDKNYYHKIGFLIAAGTSVSKLTKLRRKHTKTKFEAELDKLISSEIPSDWDDLQYNNKADYDKIIKVLLLHNLEIIRNNKSQNELFPFEAYKKTVKSLEHIHAQNTEGMDPNKSEPWFEWLKEHLAILKEREVNQELEQVIADVESVLAQPKGLNFQRFKALSKNVLAFFNDGEEEGHEFMHRIQNLALLGLTENIALSNSAFELKRRKITSMDRDGEFLPIATKRVFLKYYSDNKNPNYTLWTAFDRKEYLNDISSYLKPFVELKTNENG